MNSKSFTRTGWVNGKPDTGFFYHLTWVFSNADGETWTYIVTGRGGSSISMGSRSAFPDETVWQVLAKTMRRTPISRAPSKTL